MGYEDRDYMRGEAARGGSNPLWWILGLIAIILVVAVLRRGAMSPPGAADNLTASAGPVRVCELDFAVVADQNGALLSLLRSFFHAHGYDSTIHEAADGSRSTAMFARPNDGERIVQSISYQRIPATDEGIGQTHQLQCLVLVFEAADARDAIEETLLLIEELRLQLERELPGIVTRFDSDPKRVGYEDLE